MVGHVGTIRSVLTKEGKRALVLGARTHYYEGKGVRAVVHGVRTAAAAGCKTAGADQRLRRPQRELGAGHAGADQRPHQPHRHVSARRRHVRGPDGPVLPRIRGLAREVDPTLDEGVYAQFTGPHYETPAEVQYAKRIGADLVGMSTALEAIAGRHAGLEVFGISLVTNLAAGISPVPLSHEEVLEAGPRRAPRGCPAARGPRRCRHRPKQWQSRWPESDRTPTRPAWADARLDGDGSRTPDPPRDAASDLLAAGAMAGVRRGPGQELADRFAGTLQFGTAGLRAALGAGPTG